MALTEAQTVLAHTMTEKQLLAHVRDAARTFGWRVHHCRPGLHRKGQWSTPIQGDPGFCDLVLLRGEIGLAVELKREGKEPTPAQEGWLQAFRVAGFETHVILPRDWLSGAVERILR